jgi:hypothetical protein
MTLEKEETIKSHSGGEDKERSEGRDMLDQPLEKEPRRKKKDEKK